MSEETHTQVGDKRKWKKKKKNFLTNAKKYGKKGQMGRGTKIPEELYQYFVGILDALKNGIEDKDEREALVNNVLDRTKGEELNIVSNQLGSRVIELLLPYATAEDLERFIEILSPDLRKLCSDNFTSHIVETLLKVACKRAIEHLQTEGVDNKTEDEVPKKKKKMEKKENESQYSTEHVQKCYDFTMKLCKYALNNLEDFVWDSYANHILRSALKCLSGITLLPGEKVNKMFQTADKDNKGVPPHLTKLEYKVVPDEFKELVKEFASRLSSWPQFKDMPFKNLTSALLQVLLYAVKNVDKHITRDLVKKLLDESFAPEGWADGKGDGDEDKKTEDKPGDAKDGNLPPVFSSQPSVRLLEVALFVAKKKTYTQLYARCFINRIAQLACLPMLNFTVQRLVDNCDVKEELEPMFDELSSVFGAILACGNSGVLVALAKACLRVKGKQAQFITSLESALNCSAPESQKYFPVCVLRLTPLDRLDTAALASEYFIHVHGSVILQTMLDFQRPAKAVSGLLELSAAELVVVLSDAKGCHVTDRLCAAACVGVRARDKLVWRLKGYYQKLALSQYGSRAFEQIFHAASIEQKIKIMTEIADKSSLLNSTQYGRVVASNLDVALFKENQHNWTQKFNKKKSGETNENG